MTREEREAHYKEARDRIFADAVQGAEASNDESRASSTTGKKKKKRNSDDGFEARSSYAPYYPQYSGPSFEQANTSTNFYNPYGTNGQDCSNVQQMQPSYQSLPYGPTMQNVESNYSQGMPQFFDPNMNQYFSSSSQSQNGSYNPLMTQPNMSTSGQPQVSDAWIQPYPFYGQNTSSYSPNVQYAYGQLPYQPNAKGGRSPHPLPGSYAGSRQSFNPQTRSFVPGSGFGVSVPRSNPGFQNGSAPFSQQLPQMPQQGHYTLPPTVRKPQNPPGQSSLSKWATAANLPAKPPPPVVSQNGAAQGMPTYHNGTYSSPSQS